MNQDKQIVQSGQEGQNKRRYKRPVRNNNRNMNNNSRDTRDTRDTRDSRDSRDIRGNGQQRQQQQPQRQQQQRGWGQQQQPNRQQGKMTVRIGGQVQQQRQQQQRQQPNRQQGNRQMQQQRYQGNRQQGNRQMQQGNRQRQRPVPRQQEQKKSIVLNTPWTIYMHEIFDKNWDMDSYKEVWKINTILDFWTFFNNFRNLGGYQFFMMRGNAKPMYEDPVNKEGGSYSYVIPGQNVFDTSLFVMMKMIGETILDESVDFSNVTGLSLVPKRSTSILKVWIKNKENKVELKLDNPNLKNCRYQDHKFY